MQKSACRTRLLAEAVLSAFAVAFMAAAGAADSATAGSVPPGHPPMARPSAAPQKPAPRQSTVKLVDINSASRAELKALPGIGDAEAERIIAGRPYLSKAELVSRNVMPEGVFVSLRKQLIARPMGQPAARQ